ncbi:MAG: TonB-dependent receptor [Chitinophagaceae bacterium]|nr:TonB-dependent receptor [Chitinophagaceae bacterium]
MKAKLAMLYLLLMALVFSSAHAGESQILNGVTVTVTIKSGTLESAIREIRKVTKVSFAYDKQLLNSYHVGNFSFTKEPLESVLQKLLQDKSLAYEEVNKVIVISRKAVRNGPSPAGSAVKKDTVITGVVIDDNNKPMSGVTVGVNGSTTMTSTDGNGRYKILVDHDTTVLVFSYIGFATQQIAVGNQTSINVRLSPGQSKDLEEVAVVAFGKQRKISLIGAQSTLNVEELKQPTANLSAMLAGRISGVIGVQRSGEPGKSSADVWIRGISTFGAGNSTNPLILVDGVERDFNNIDPEDVESFTILKDASGTAVYGVRGANGVILVKTKSGKVGKPQVFLDYNEGVNTFTRIPKMMDGISYMHLANEALTTRNQAPMYSQDYIDKTASGLDPMVYPNVDWLDAVLNKTGHMRRANINASGGVQNAQYYVSLSYYEESSFLKTDDLQKYNSSLKYRRYNFTTNLNLNLTRTTKLDVNLKGYFSNLNGPALSTQAIFQSAMDAAPVIYPVMYPGGLVPGISPNGGFRNPYADLVTRGYRGNNTNEINANVRLTQSLSEVTPGLSVTAMAAFDTHNEANTNRGKREDTWFVNMNSPHNPDGTLNLTKTYISPSPYLGYSSDNNGKRLFYTEGAVNYDRGFDRHHVTGLALFYASSKQNPFGDYLTSIPERYIGLAGRVMYSYDDRYFFEGNLGYNGSELFSPSKRYGLFPAGGVGWVVSNEKFFGGLKRSISFLKFRYSDGVVGQGSVNDPNLRFLYLDKMNGTAGGYSFGNFNGVGGIAISRYGSNVSWATSHKQDLGMEIKTLGNQLSLIVDVFKEHRKGIFLARASNVSFMGLTEQQYGNLGVVDNKGIDATLEYNTRFGRVTFGVRGSFTYNKDKLLQDDLPPQDYPWMNHRGHNILGEYGYIADGLFVDQKDINDHPVPGGDKSNIMPGDIRYKDLNGDGKIDYHDVAYIGRGDVPSTVYGFGFNVGYSGFNLTVFFQGVTGADRYIKGDGIYPFTAEQSNVFAIAADRWTPEHPNQRAFYPRLAYGNANNFNNYQTSSWWVKDISFMRLKTAQLSYNLPTTFLSRWGVKNAAVYCQGLNLLTFSKFKLWDPELNNDDGNAKNGTAYPNVRTITMGVNLKF